MYLVPPGAYAAKRTPITEKMKSIKKRVNPKNHLASYVGFENLNKWVTPLSDSSTKKGSMIDGKFHPYVMTKPCRIYHYCIYI